MPRVLAVDLGDLHHGQFLTVADLLVITLAATHLEGDDLVAADVFHNIGLDRRSGDDRIADGDVALLVDEEDAVEGVDLTRGGGQEFDLDGVACSDAVLLTAGFQNSVHKNFPPTGGRGRKQTPGSVSTPVFLALKTLGSFSGSFQRRNKRLNGCVATVANVPVKGPNGRAVLGIVFPTVERWQARLRVDLGNFRGFWTVNGSKIFASSQSVLLDLEALDPDLATR